MADQSITTLPPGRKRNRRVSREPLSLFPDALRWCHGCQQGLPRTAFSRSPRTKDGLRSWCRECAIARSKAHYLAAPEAYAAKHRRNTYGLDAAAFDAMVIAQDSCCAICGTSMGSGKDRHVDHCHATGRIRGLLCSKCNTALGQADDSPERLRAMADYIERHANETTYRR